jgi:hypothetical protein
MELQSMSYNMTEQGLSHKKGEMLLKRHESSKCEFDIGHRKSK